MASRDAQVRWRWLRLLLLIGALASGAAGQYWLSLHLVPKWSALAWSAAGACFVVLFLLSRDTRELPALNDGLPPHIERGLLAVVLAIGLFFTAFGFWRFPPGLNHDAAWEAMYAIRILNGEHYTPYVNEAWGRETFTFYLKAASLWLLGPTKTAVIAPSMVAGALTLPFFFWWARNMFGVRLALLATVLFGASGWHLVFSRSGWRSDFQPFFTVVTCCFFVRGMLTAKPTDFFLSGAALALTVNVYNAARVLPGLFVLWLLAIIPQSWRWRGFVRRYGVGLLFMALAFVIVVFPLAWFAIHHWSIFQSRAAALSGFSTPMQAVREALLLFNYMGNGDDFFIREPGLEYPVAIFLVFGVLWSLLKLRDERAQFLLLGMVIGLVPGLVSRPNLNRCIGTMPFVYFFAALGVTFFAREFRRLLPRVGGYVGTIFAIGVTVAAMQATYGQYLGSTPRRLWGFYPETAILGEKMKTLVPHYAIWVGDTPYFPRDALSFLSYQGRGNPEVRNYTWLDDVSALLRMRPTAPPGKGLAFLIENAGNNPRVVAALERRYPKHETIELTYEGRVFLKGVLVPPEGVALAVYDSGSEPAAAPPAPAEPAGAPAEPAAAPATPEEVPTGQDAAGKLQQPRGVAVQADGTVVVADFGNYRIQEFAPDLSFLRQWGSQGSSPGHFKQPCGVAVGPDAKVFVADTWNQRVQVFSKTGEFLLEWGGGFFGPRGIAVDKSGTVFVTDTGNNRVLRFSSSGVRELEFGGRGDAPGKLQEPVGIGVDEAGQVYVCDNANARLQIFTRDGQLVKAFPVPGWQSTVYSEPYVAVDPKGTIWVTVPLAKEVRAYDHNGKLLQMLGAPTVTFTTPMGIGVSRARNELLVADLDGRLVPIPVDSKPKAGGGKQ